MKAKILVHFQICISVPLTKNIRELSILALTNNQFSFHCFYQKSIQLRLLAAVFKTLSTFNKSF